MARLQILWDLETALDAALSDLEGSDDPLLAHVQALMDRVAAGIAEVNQALDTAGGGGLRD